jgi:AraC-like DNA-binding protein
MIQMSRPILVEKKYTKIKMAKTSSSERMTDPPSLADLALEIAPPLLKEGFKEVYGILCTDSSGTQLEYARQLLDSGQHNVNEVGLKVGYSTGSHFISA